MHDQIISELQAQRDRIDAAIAALQPKRQYNRSNAGRSMSAKARKLVSEAMKRRWAERKAEKNKLAVVKGRKAKKAA